MHHQPHDNASGSNREDYSWREACKSADLQDGNAVEVIIGKTVVAIFRQADQVYAMDGMCSHQGGPIAEGTVQHGCVTCPWHGWQYELSTGIQTINRQPLQECFEVRENHGVIEVFIGD